MLTDGRTTDGRTTDGRTTDARVTGILIAHLGAFGSGELKIVGGVVRSQSTYLNDGRTEGRTDAHTDGQTDGRTDMGNA